MPKLGTVALIGVSGRRYEFAVYLREDAFKPLGAVYFLAKRIPFAEAEAEYTWIYVGESADISQRPLAGKHKPCIDATRQTASASTWRMTRMFGPPPWPISPGPMTRRAIAIRPGPRSHRGRPGNYGPDRPLP